jgi:DNA-binding HxlR family transcriptional regulator
VLHSFRMERSEYSDDNCSVAGTLQLVGERWSLLILREAFLGVKRFDQLQRNLGIARNILADRLQRLVGAGIVERKRYQERPERFEYRLTQKGLDLYPTLVALMQWGDRHLAGKQGAPVVLEHKACGAETHPHFVCSECGEPIGARDVRAKVGPGALARTA